MCSVAKLQEQQAVCLDEIVYHVLRSVYLILIFVLYHTLTMTDARRTAEDKTAALGRKDEGVKQGVQQHEGGMKQPEGGVKRQEGGINQQEGGVRQQQQPQAQPQAQKEGGFNKDAGIKQPEAGHGYEGGAQKASNRGVEDLGGKQKK